MGFLRLWLALAVVAVHTGGLPFYRSINGFLAVKTFYVISGFYMALIRQKYENQYFLFLSNRFFRLWPSYFAVLLLSVIACFCLPSLLPSYQPTAQGWNASTATPGTKLLLRASNASLVGQDALMFSAVGNDGHLHFTPNFRNEPDPSLRYLFVPQAWSVSLEILFYLIAPFLTRLRVPYLILIGLASIGARAACRSAGLLDDPWNYRFFPAELYYFVLGILAYRYHERTKTRVASEHWIAGISIALLGLIAVEEYFPFSYKNHLIPLLVAAGIPSLFRWTGKNRIDRFVGELSYPVYIAHLLVLSCVGACIGYENKPWLPILTMLFSVLAALALFWESTGLWMRGGSDESESALLYLQSSAPSTKPCAFFRRGVYTFMSSLFLEQIMHWLAVLICVLASIFVRAADLPRSTPEAQGVSSAQVRAFVEAADQQINTMNSFMLVRHGRVVAEGWWSPFSAESPHALYSLSKSFTSTAVGFAISEGKLSLDDEVLKFFPDLAPAEPSKNLKAMRVRDLLIMSGGQESEAKLNNSTTVPWAKIFLEHPVTFKPGTHFVYNTPGTYMLSAIVQKVSGQPVLEYLRPRLFEPLGIANPTWSSNFQGINFGGWGLSIRTEDIAKFGVFVSQKGQWEGKQLLPAAWIEAATARQTSTGSSPNSDWDQGYGYQFWRCRHGAFRGDGAMGQYCIVIPEQDAVVAITSGVKDMQSVLNVVWDKLLPAFQQNALPENKEEQSLLLKVLSTLSVRPPQGSATSPAAVTYAGKEFSFAANKEKLESLKLEIDPKDNTTALVLKVNGSEYRVKCGSKIWEKTRLAFGTFNEQPVAASFAWTTENTLTVQLCFYETPNQILASLQFNGNELLLDTEILPGSAKQPQLKGLAK